YCHLFGVIENLGQLMQPSIHTGKHFPIGSRCLEPPFQQPLHSFKLDGKPLFSATRSMEALICVRRECNLRPEDSSGGRPSSVRELRTAKQYSRTVWASSSVCPSKLRSMGRTPRTCFLSSFFA